MKLKALGTAAMTVALMLAAASGAAASTPTFTAKAGAALSGSGLSSDVFTIDGEEVSCDSAALSGEVEGTNPESLAVSPSYAECAAFGFVSAAVTTTGCAFIFEAETDEAERADMSLGGCSGGNLSIVVDTLFADCTALIKDQAIPSAVSYENKGEDIAVLGAATGLHAEVTKSTGVCPLELGTTTSATYVGETTVQAGGSSLQYDS